MDGSNAETLDFVANALVEFLRSDVLDDENIEIALDTNILEIGIVDSLSTVSIIAFIDEEFDVQIRSEDILPENFFSIRSISHLVTANAKNLDGMPR